MRYELPTPIDLTIGEELYHWSADLKEGELDHTLDGPSQFANRIISRGRTLTGVSTFETKLAAGEPMAFHGALGGIALRDESLLMYARLDGTVAAGVWRKADDERHTWRLAQYGYGDSPGKAQEQLKEAELWSSDDSARDFNPAYCLAAYFATAEKRQRQSSALAGTAKDIRYSEILTSEVLWKDARHRADIEREVAALAVDEYAQFSIDGGDNYLLRLPNGRILSFRTTGDPEGYPIVLVPGTLSGGTGGIVPSSRALQEGGYRFVVVDRPGNGRSDRHAGRTVADTALYVGAAMRALRIPVYGVIGRSAGAPFALAHAAQGHDNVDMALILASPVPYDAEGLDLSDLGHNNRSDALLDIRERVALFAERSAGIRLDPWSHVRRIAPDFTEADWEVMGNPTNATRVAISHYLAVQYCLDGWGDDIQAFQGDWGQLDEKTIGPRTRAVLWAGEKDPFTPEAYAKWLQKRLGLPMRIEKGASHFTAMDLMPLLHRYFDERLSGWRRAKGLAY